MNEAVVFGAGNIGRSFIGNIFTRGGWKVSFIDADKKLVDLLNRRGGYSIKVKQSGREDEVMEVTGITAVHSEDTEAVMKALISCRICSTSVGKGALKYVIPVLADAVKRRLEAGAPPLDVIIAENIRKGSEYFRNVFKSQGLSGFETGLVETSIGKMVPIMKADDLAVDPLVLHAEKYNTLIVDKNGFLNDVPALPDIKAVDNIGAWVDRKLFIHNLGHAAAAYFGYETCPSRTLIADVLREKSVYSKVCRVMEEAAVALFVEYPDDFTQAGLNAHIEDLLHRFENRALGDTVYRVGRDLGRKLNRTDRVLGAAALCIKHGLKCSNILDVFHAALSFEAKGPDGMMFEADRVFMSSLEKQGIKRVIQAQLELGSKDEQLLKLLLDVCGV